MTDEQIIAALKEWYLERRKTAKDGWNPLENWMDAVDLHDESLARCTSARAVALAVARAAGIEVEK